MPALAHHEATDHILTLADGRRLGYAVYGDPDGVPVLNCHGGLVNRADVAPADAAARDLGVCIISPDRPGVSLSDRKPGHALLDWVRDDVTELLDRLGVDRLRVMGWSEGGQYALACAYGLGDRVERAASIAGAPPLDDPATFAELNAMDQRLSRLSRKARPVARAYFGVTRLAAWLAPGVLVKATARSAGGDALGALEAEGHWSAQMLGEGARDTAGAVDEYRAFVGPWGFRLDEVETFVDIHQGDADKLVPMSFAERLHAGLPQSSLTVYPGEGHMISLTRRREVMAMLLEPVPDAAEPTASEPTD